MLPSFRTSKQDMIVGFLQAPRFASMRRPGRPVNGRAGCNRDCSVRLSDINDCGSPYQISGIPSYQKWISAILSCVWKPPHSACPAFTGSASLRTLESDIVLPLAREPRLRYTQELPLNRISMIGDRWFGYRMLGEHVEYPHSDRCSRPIGFHRRNSHCARDSELASGRLAPGDATVARRLIASPSSLEPSACRKSILPRHPSTMSSRHREQRARLLRK